MPHRSDVRLAELIARQVLPRYPGESVLDIGCGDGVVNSLMEASCKYTGLDIDDACIYEQKHDNPNVRYLKSDQIGELMSNDGPWDTVLLLDVIEHTKGFTTLFEMALSRANRHVIVSLPNELNFIDRIRMLFGVELNAHSLDQVDMPEGFKHQFIINIAKARSLLNRKAAEAGYDLVEEVLQPLVSKHKILQPSLWMIRHLSSDQFWSRGSVFIYRRRY